MTNVDKLDIVYSFKNEHTNISLVNIVYRKIICILQKSQFTIRDVFLGQMYSI